MTNPVKKTICFGLIFIFGIIGLTEGNNIIINEDCSTWALGTGPENTSIGTGAGTDTSNVIFYGGTNVKSKGSIAYATTLEVPPTPTDFSAVASGYDDINVSWTSPGTHDDDSYNYQILLIYNTTGVSGVVEKPTDGQNYSVGNTDLGGTVIYNGDAVSSTSFLHENLSEGTHYYYAWHFNAYHNYSNRASILAPDVEKYARAKNILAARILREAQQSLGRGDLSTAEHKTETCLRINPEFGSAYAILGYIKLRSGDINAAVESLEKAVQYNPESRSSWYNLGNIYRKRQEYQKAEEALLRAIQLDPTYAKAYTGLGQAYLAEKDYDKAETYLKKAIELDPESEAARDSYGELMNTLERYDEAIEHLSAAAYMIRNPGDKYFVNYRLAYAYNRSGEHQKALGVAKEVTRANPRFGGGWFELGVAYAKTGETQNAINAFNEGRSDRDWRGIIEPERERLLTGKDLSF